MKETILSLKKITFPGPRAVRKNTVNVLLMSAIIGAFVCLADFVAVTAVEMLLATF